MGRVCLEVFEAVQHNQFHAIICLFDNQIHVGLGHGGDGCRRTAQSHQRPRRIVAHSGRGRIEKIVDATDEATPLGDVRSTDLVDKLNNHQLKDFIEGAHLVDAGAQKVESTRLINGDEHHKRIALTRSILFSLEIVLDRLRRIRKKRLEVFVDGVDGKNGISSNLGFVSHGQDINTSVRVNKGTWILT